MTTLALSDCLRATPSRTIGAVLIALVRRVRQAAFRPAPIYPTDDLSDRTLADIGLTRAAIILDA